jgi:hypothetical protein
VVEYGWIVSQGRVVFSVFLYLWLINIQNKPIKIIKAEIYESSFNRG